MRWAHDATGFTIVEMLVTVVLAGIFVTFFLQMYRANNSQQQALVRLSQAGDIAQSNLAKFPSLASLTGYTCSTDASSSNPNNLTINPAAPGHELLSSALYEPTSGNLGATTQSVRAYSPQGCNTGSPVKIISKVRYGHPGQEHTVEHATYVF